MIEIEKTYLAKFLPEGLEKCKSKEIFDIYIPKASVHPKIRIRKNGDNYEITKKVPINEEDASQCTEHTIKITKAEFDGMREMDTKKVRKIRYYYEHDGRQAEIDVFQDALLGLILVDFEFDSNDVKLIHILPDFCLADVTNSEFIAGGMLAGKSYGDIEEKLKSYGYKKLSSGEIE